MTDLAALSAHLDDAARNATAIPQLEEPINLADAYQVQAGSMARRYARGERRVGIKMGFTSLAKMAQMGIDEMIWGRLTDAMQVADGGTIRMADFVHPRVEPEVAFILSADLPRDVTEEQALAACSGIAPALEIIDSRYRNFRFSLTDVVADNSSSSAFVVGPAVDPATDIADVAFTMMIDGVAKQTGSSSAILGHPLKSLVAAARLAADAGEPLKAGDVVMAGGATAAEPPAAGQAVRLEVQSLGSVGFTVEG